MSEQSTSQQPEAVQKLRNAVATSLAKGVRKDKIATELVSVGWTQEAAVQMVDDVERAINSYKSSPEGRKVLAKKYQRHMIYGALWTVGGTAVTIFTYAAATSSPSGGTYFVAWGAVIFGLYEFFQGLVGWMKYKG